MLDGGESYASVPDGVGGENGMSSGGSGVLSGGSSILMGGSLPAERFTNSTASGVRREERDEGGDEDLPFGRRAAQPYQPCSLADDPAQVVRHGESSHAGRQAIHLKAL